jgi:hypothetical protein
MKRPFLSGLSLSLFIGEVVLYHAVPNWVVGVIFVVSGALAFEASRSPRSKSWWTAISFWALGCFVVGISLFIFYMFVRP